MSILLNATQPAILSNAVYPIPALIYPILADYINKWTVGLDMTTEHRIIERKYQRALCKLALGKIELRKLCNRRETWAVEFLPTKLYWSAAILDSGKKLQLLRDLMPPCLTSLPTSAQNQKNCQNTISRTKQRHQKIDFMKKERTNRTKKMLQTSLKSN